VVSWASAQFPRHRDCSPVVARLPSCGHPHGQCLRASLGMEAPVRLVTGSVIIPRVGKLFICISFCFSHVLRTDYSSSTFFPHHQLRNNNNNTPLTSWCNLYPRGAAPQGTPVCGVWMSRASSARRHPETAP
jgi:hypothetical protein